MSIYVPETEQVKLYFELGVGEYSGVENDATSLSENPKAFEDWLAAHDQALREQIAEEIEARRNEPGQIEMADRFGGYHAGQSAGFDLAARIARGEVTR